MSFIWAVLVVSNSAIIFNLTFDEEESFIELTPEFFVIAGVSCDGEPL